MVANQSAQGLASLGRNGDSMLVHMSPNEVAGLQGLAMAHGGSLTINPETGLPEAFSLGGVFSSLLPMAAGMFMGPAAGAMFGPGSGIATFLSSPLGAGLTTGALTAAMTGDIGKGAMAGLGAAGGAGLGQGISNFGATGSAAPATTAELNQGITQAATQKAISGASPNVGGWYPGKEAFAAGPGPQLQSMGQGLGGMQTVAPTIKAAAPLASPTFESLKTGMGAITEAPGKFVESYGPGKLALQAAGPIIGGFEPSDLGYGEEPLYTDPDTGKYRGPQGQLNLSDKYSSGLRLVAKGGYIDGYAQGGTISTGGIRDLYGSRDDQIDGHLSQDGYGIGRLNNLAAQESLNDAKTLGYADGGDVGMNLNELPTLNVNTGEQTSASGIAAGKQLNPIGQMYYRMMSMGSLKPNISDDKSTQEFFYSPHITWGTDPTTQNFRKLVETGSYARGGYLDGQGDGMSDSIPATIEGKQPARLADGEFVVPADVVSHLGNGSSKAGSKRLYAMLDKVRQARTGTKKQGKEINPAKYMPA